MSEKSIKAGTANLRALTQDPVHQRKAALAAIEKRKTDQAAWHNWWKNGHYRPKIRRARSKKAKEQWKDPVFRAKMLAVLAKANERYGPPIPEEYKKEYKRLRYYFGAETARKLIAELIEKDKGP